LTAWIGVGRCGASRSAPTRRSSPSAARTASCNSLMSSRGSSSMR
jgi:hypothetical protein